MCVCVFVRSGFQEGVGENGGLIEIQYMLWIRMRALNSTLWLIQINEFRIICQHGSWEFFFIFRFYSYISIYVLLVKIVSARVTTGYQSFIRKSIKSLVFCGGRFIWRE